MRQMYIILSVAGWIWLAVLAVVMAARRWSLQQQKRPGFPIEPVERGDNPQAVDRT